MTTLGQLATSAHVGGSGCVSPPPSLEGPDRETQGETAGAFTLL